jgi:hypothetical protein
VDVEPTATADPRWASLAPQITPFLEKVKKGKDLTPHLSLEPHTRGFTPAASEIGPNVDRWADKDMVLNAMGYHHFHLGTTIEAAGHVARTNEILFSQVTRERFEVVAIFDHTVFDTRISPTEPMSKERERLWKIFDERLTRGMPPRSVVMAPPIATSGHSIMFTRRAMDYAHVIREIDQKLDDPAYARGL